MGEPSARAENLSILFMESKTCPKCGSHMQGPKELRGLTGEIELVSIGGYSGDKIRAFYCESCGFVELYHEKMK